MAVKKFEEEQDAIDFAAGKKTASTSASTKVQPEKFYGVAVGNVPGVYTDWDTASEQIKNVKGPKYKRFTTRAEAEEFVKSGGIGGKTVKKETKSSVVVTEPAAKKLKTHTQSSSNSVTLNDKVLKVWTDGSSLGNGKHGARAGVGVFFGDGDSR